MGAPVASAMRRSSFEVCGLIARKQRKEFEIVAATVGLGLRQLAFLHQQPQHGPHNQGDQNSVARYSLIVITDPRFIHTSDSSSLLRRFVDVSSNRHNRPPFYPHV